MGDKISSAAQDANGKAKEGREAVMDDDRLEAGGHADQLSANAKQAQRARRGGPPTAAPGRERAPRRDLAAGNRRSHVVP